MNNLPLRGAGIGLRLAHAHALLDMPEAQAPSWIELLADNHLSPATTRIAQQLAERYPVVLHCVGMNLGSVDPLDLGYLDQIKRLISLLDPIHVSDHLAFTGLDGVHHHDLWPIPHTHDAITHVSARIEFVQAHLGQHLHVENISTYARHDADHMSEVDFLTSIARESGCGLILDLNNLVVNQHNHGSCALTTMHALLHCPIAYVHLAGHSVQDQWLIDAHDSPPGDEVWALYREALNVRADLPALIEWDAKLPAAEILCEHARHAEQLMTHSHITPSHSLKQGAMP